MTTRRAFLGLAGGLFAAPAAAQLPPRLGAARMAALDDAVRRITGNAHVRAGRVRLELPPLIDNGNAVPLTVAVESPMTPADHVAAVHVLTETNPQPQVISARLGPRAGRAVIATRARIADTGHVLAIAQLSDGTFWSARVHVIVTVPACSEEGPS